MANRNKDSISLYLDRAYAKAVDRLSRATGIPKSTLMRMWVAEGVALECLGRIGLSLDDLMGLSVGELDEMRRKYLRAEARSNLDMLDAMRRLRKLLREIDDFEIDNSTVGRFNLLRKVDQLAEAVLLMRGLFGRMVDYGNSDSEDVEAQRSGAGAR